MRTGRCVRPVTDSSSVSRRVPDVPAHDRTSDVAGSRQVLLVVDDDGICAEASLGACLLLNASRDDVVGRGLGDLLEASSRERFAAHWGSARRMGGRVGTFALAPPASLEVQMTVSSESTPERHLIALEAASETTANGHVNGNGHSRFAAADRCPSAREREVLDLLAHGATDEQIAALLSLSPATVQSHVRNAKAKLGARTRAQAVALAFSRGLIDTSA
jgi:DNA-binding CsgD family transcriptional regulator